jgi:hypothetical protein
MIPLLPHKKRFNSCLIFLTNKLSVKKEKESTEGQTSKVEVSKSNFSNSDATDKKNFQKCMLGK